MITRKNEQIVTEIKTLCDAYFKADSKAKNRKRENVLSRQTIMYFARKYTKESLQSIGVFVGDFTFKSAHANCIHAIKQVDNQIFSDANFKSDFENLNAEILNIVKISKKIKLPKQIRIDILISELEARIRGVELTCNCGVIEYCYIQMWKSRIEKIKML
jgi:hypothetical protein